jgi:uncharacterized protein YndB with AHSA1/START domain
MTPPQSGPPPHDGRHTTAVGDKVIEIDKGEAMTAPVTSDRDFTREIAHDACSERIFDALATLDGLAAWWTPIVRGTPTTGGEIELRFSGLDEKIVMRVNEARRPSAVVWNCLTHTGHPEWEGTKIVFELTKDEQSAVLKFRHFGLSPTLSCYETCESGWEHFLTSLLNYAERGEGNPF